jgi:LmbE family N-acetylglucosaminyl deacetylase
LLTLRSLCGTGPVVGLPTVSRALIVAPHPDDESIGCGGTAALLTAAGAEVGVVFATDGEATRGSDLPPAKLAPRRRDEARRATQLLGIRAPVFLGLPDGALSERTSELSRALTDELRRARPELLLVPSPLEEHPDHRAVNTALFQAAQAGQAGLAGLHGLHGPFEVWGYETSTPLPANRIVDITSVLAQKEEALAAHATASLAFDITAIVGLNRYRSVHGLMGRGWAEAYLGGSATEYLSLVGAVARG